MMTERGNSAGSSGELLTNCTFLASIGSHCNCGGFAQLKHYFWLSLQQGPRQGRSASHFSAKQTLPGSKQWWLRW
jgi:hypothetical protein